MLNLMLHCGAQRTDKHNHLMIREPESMGPMHHPIPHIRLINEVESQLKSNSLTIRQAHYGVLKDGSRMFGLIEVTNGYIAQDYSTVIGLRASHDQTIAAGIVAGSGVFVCDNLCFSGEVKLATKQTTYILDRLSEIVAVGVQKSKLLIEQQHERFELYKKSEMPKRVGDAAITELIRRDAISGSQAGRVIEHWDNPTHEDFEVNGHSVWRLQNAVTEVYKPRNGQTYMGVLPKRSQKLTEFCDELAGVNW